MTKTKGEIISQFRQFIRNNGGPLRSWYVGITEEPRNRLQAHSVKNGYIYVRASSHAVAREIEKHFIRLGTDGGPGGGDADARYVYAYKKMSYTNP